VLIIDLSERAHIHHLIRIVKNSRKPLPGTLQDFLAKGLILHAFV